MLDGGSMVNTITESHLVHILNTQRSMGVALDDKRHPVKQMENWPDEEAVRGVAGGKTVPLLGAVILEITMAERGTNQGPNIRARFKITEKGSTDRVGMILGARAIDHPSLGGLGHVSGPNGHWMEKLGIWMDRIEVCPSAPKTDSIYAMIYDAAPVTVCSAFDSDDENLD